MPVPPRFTIACLSLLWLSFALPTAAHADITIDAFTDSLNSETYPVSTKNYIWAGNYNKNSRTTDNQTQSSLHGAYGGSRKTQLTSTDTTRYVKAFINTSGNSNLQISNSQTTSITGRVRLEYDIAPSLSLNLSQQAGFQISVGSLTSGKTLYVTIAVTCQTGSVGSQTLQIGQSGTYYASFSADVPRCTQAAKIVYTFDTATPQGVAQQGVGYYLYKLSIIGSPPTFCPTAPPPTQP